MITIVNVGPYDQPDPMGECTYEVRINRKVITRFRHTRKDGLAACLAEASRAAAAEASPTYYCPPLCPDCHRLHHHDKPCAHTVTGNSDTQRLDWLQASQKTAWRVTHDEWAPTTESEPNRVRTTVFDGWAVNDDDAPQKDIRATIDYAMSGRQEICECRDWCRDGRDALSPHHPRCARYTPPPEDPRFARFGASMWKYITGMGGDFCGAEISEDILPLAQNAGLCRRVTYDPEMHGEIADAEPGDEIWWWGDSSLRQAVRHPSLHELSCADLVDFLVAESSEDAVFCFISAISCFGITDREDAIAAMEKDPATRKWAVETAAMIPEPHALQHEAKP